MTCPVRLGRVGGLLLPQVQGRAEALPGGSFSTHFRPPEGGCLCSSPDGGLSPSHQRAQTLGRGTALLSRGEGDLARCVSGDCVLWEFQASAGGLREGPPSPVRRVSPSQPSLHAGPGDGQDRGTFTLYFILYCTGGIVGFFCLFISMLRL